MNKFTRRFLIWTLALLFVAVLIGCQEEEQEQEQSMSPKKTKHVAAENIQLKKDMASKDAEIENQKKLLADCEKEKEELNKRLNTKSEGLMEVIMAGMDKESQTLKVENKQLKKQIEELKSKLAEK